MTGRVPHFTVQQVWLKPWDTPWRNINILNAAQLQVSPVGKQIVGSDRPFPAIRQLDFQFRNVCLLNAAQRLVFPVGEAIDETVPAKLTRSFDIQFPNITARPVPAAMPFSPEIFDRSPQPYRPPADFQFVNLVLGAALPDLTKLFRPPLITRQQAPTSPVDFQGPNLAVKVSVAPMRPIGGQLLDQAPPRYRSVDWQPANLVLGAVTPPDLTKLFRPPLITRQAPVQPPTDPILPNLLTGTLGVVSRPVIPPEFADKPASQQRAQEFVPPNIPALAVAQSRVQPIGEMVEDVVPTPPPHQVDFQFTNVAALAAAQSRVKPIGAALEESKPAVLTRPFDIQPTNIPILAAAQAQVHPVGAALDEIVPATTARQLDFQFANIAIGTAPPPVKPQGKTLDEITPRVDPRQLDFQFANVALLNFQQLQVKPIGPKPIFERPIAPSLPVDATLPNLLASTLTPTVAAKPPFQAIFERPVAVSLPVDGPIPNLLTTTLAVVAAEPATAIWGPWPQHAASQPDLLPPNLLTTTLSVVQKPTVPPLFGDRPVPQAPPQDFIYNNLLLALSTLPGVPRRPNPYLFTDRPSPAAPSWDQAPPNNTILLPPPVAPVGLHQNPMFITMGRLSQLGNLPS